MSNINAKELGACVIIIPVIVGVVSLFAGILVLGLAHQLYKDVVSKAREIYWKKKSKKKMAKDE